MVDMTPAEVRERCAVLVEERSIRLEEERPIRLVTEAEACAARASLAAAIRALPLAEAPLTPREKLRRVREAREVLATARVAYVRPGIARVYNGATGGLLGEWRPSGVWVCMDPRAGGKRGPDGIAGLSARTWVLDTLRAEGWDVVEEGDGDGDR